ncbi:MAG: DegT/DnrJ/EryC1/StrS aminotransferase family protein [Puniceicoccales bacterium]|jgi:perosamine synthetase|nr:DegT/DnrJ/EryC1/StrS aminotransferase family protein [Puniceicoccales bacterium]
MKQSVPFFQPSLGQDERENVLSVIKTGWLTTGMWCQKFEQAFAKYIGVKHCVAVNSATAALHLSVIANGICPGEAVLIPTMTFVSTAEVLYYHNIYPILVDCDPKDLTMSAQDARCKLLQAREKGVRVTGIIPVHYAGKMVQMDWVESLAEEFGLKIIEDAAHCCGSKYFSDRYQKWFTKCPTSLTQCYSFYCTKCITTGGEGGIVATDSDELANKIRSLSLHGLSTNAWERFDEKGENFYDVSMLGYKYNLTDMAAAMGCAQLAKADHLRERRTQAVATYKKALKEISCIDYLQNKPEHFVHAYHLFVIKLNTEQAPLSRNQLLQELKANHIVPSVHWKPLHLHSFYQKQGFHVSDFPNATHIFDQIISLPLFPDITEEQIYYVANTLKKLLANG